MADLLDKASAWLHAQRVKSLSHMVVYQRGTESVELATTIGRTVFEQTDEYGIVQKTECRDFLVSTADLVLGGTTVLPKPGDRIREAVTGETYIYEVLAPSTANASAWRYSDPQRRTLRIHTKLITTEAT